MRKLTPELRRRLEHKEGNNVPPLSVNWFVDMRWDLNADSKEHAQRCYSTLSRPVTMNGSFFSGMNTLLDFNEETDQGFVMNSEDLIYGASSGFRVLDYEGLASNIVRVVNETHRFPFLHFDVWMHYSQDAEEINSLLYGVWMFSGFVTRIESQEDERCRPIAKVWGGHAGVLASKIQPIAETAASVLAHPNSLAP